MATDSEMRDFSLKNTFGPIIKQNSKSRWMYALIWETGAKWVPLIHMGPGGHLSNLTRGSNLCAIIDSSPLRVKTSIGQILRESQIHSEQIGPEFGLRKTI